MNRNTMAITLSTIFFSSVLGLGQVKMEEENPWLWSLEKVRSIVGNVRAGKDLTPKYWPEGARVAVALSFDFDAGKTHTTHDDLRRCLVCHARGNCKIRETLNMINKIDANPNHRNGVYYLISKLSLFLG